MTIAWLAPAALLGLALIALPIAIHLLVRQHARTLAYPSLRFLRETQLAAFRRRSIQDAPLLLCRVAIIALAAAALAGPLLQTPSRTAGYAGRTARAVVVLEGAGDPLVATLQQDAFASAIFQRSSVADSIADAVRWLDRQPPSAREIVIAGTLRRGILADSDLMVVPDDIGLRFEHVTASTPTDVTWPILTRRDGALVRVDHTMRLEGKTTRVTEGAATGVPDDLVSISARDVDLPLARAALRAALHVGVPWSDFERRIVIAWDGADDAAVTRAASTASLIRMPVPSPSSAAADEVYASLRKLSPRPDRFDPVMIAAEQLSAWTRRPGPPSVTAPLADEGDRRWLWGAVLVMLAVEAWIRRDRKASAASAADAREVRVA